ncbi:formimidoylglutamase [Parvicella tangerina]|uniref:Formimidoylglutamase n=1 Tax=Parvicella tangerina TaxID=2829795 RepID=A0A916NU85_9FLAO|nr:formimidoylglutamase [Parvicella tangerina]CAG5087655.1 Formimidoylglutamase [Parvicella tangerina]
MNLDIYFQPLEPGNYHANMLGSMTSFYDESGFPDLEEADIAIIGVKDSRGAGTLDFNSAPDIIRRHLYTLYHHHSRELKMVDLGNITAGETLQDTYSAVADVVRELNKKSVFTIILGGSQDITYGNYLAYEKLEQTVNLAVIDDSIDLSEKEEDINNKNFLSKIVIHQPNYLFNFSAIGYQTYFVNPSIKKLMEDLYFDTYRLGEIQSNIMKSEPIIRNADILSVDVSAIRYAELNGKASSGPNGFYGEEICQMMRYAGMSDKLSSIGFYEYYPENDKNDSSAMLVAQMIWCVLDGFYSRKQDYPFGSKDSYTKYRIHIENTEHELVFYKSDKSDRWWMDVPYPPNQILKFERHHLVPCNYDDYRDSSEGKIPDLWWKTYEKLN